MSAAAPRVATGIVMAVRCHYCSKQRAPSDVARMANGVVICQLCFERHLKALDMLAGNAPAGCQTCNLTYDELEAITGPTVRFVAVPKDGIYQIQCGPCADGYIPLRRDLIKGTAFAAAARLF